MKTKWWIWLLGLMGGAVAVVQAETPAVTSSTWRGFKRLDFVVAGRPALLVVPKTPAAGKP